MTKKLALYRKAAQEFADALVAALGDKVDSVVLYGSVARGRIHKESDIDVLVIGDRESIRDKVSEIAYDVNWGHDFDTYLVPLVRTPDQVERLINWGSYFIGDVLAEGVVLYDNGTFSRVREQALATGQRVS